MLKKNAAFTLIELLVVIAIIGVLATIVLVSLDRSRAKSRDARRLKEIQQLQLALDMYYDDTGAYPISGFCEGTRPNSGWCNSVQSFSDGHWVRNGSSNLSKFLSQDPIDPKQTASAHWLPTNGGTYFYFSSGYGGPGQWYMIIFGLENYPHAIEANDGVTTCDGTYFHYGNGSNGIVTVGRNCQNSI